MKKLFAIALLFLGFMGQVSSAEAAGACPTFTYGLVLTAAQWQACFDQKQNALGYTPVNKAGDIMLGPLGMAASTTAGAGLNIAPGVDPSSPNNGDIWVTSAGLFVRINGATVGPLAPAAGSTPPTVSSSAITLTTAGDYVFIGPVPRTWVLSPLSSAITPYYLKNRSSVTLTIAAAGSDQLYNMSPVAFITLGPGESARIVNDGTYWDVE